LPLATEKKDKKVPQPQGLLNTNISEKFGGSSKDALEEE